MTSQTHYIDLAKFYSLIIGSSYIIDDTYGLIGYGYQAYADGTFLITYKTDDGIEYYWSADTNDGWYYFDKNNNNLMTYSEIDIEKKTDAVPICNVQFTDETLVLWNGETSHGNTGLAMDDDGVWRYYENDTFVPKTGIVDYQGGSFFVADGVLCSDANGLAEYGGQWYFLASGQIQKQHTGLSLYDGEWFYVENGIMNASKNGLVTYDGGQFLVAAGRICYDVSGLWQNSINIGGDNKWYFLSEGQVQTQHTGLAQYDGAWFYIIGGMLAEDFTGTVEYDGSQFQVVNGQVVF